MAGWLLVSLGNRLRGDDGVGPVVLDGLRRRCGERAHCIENSGDIARLLDIWRGRHTCLLDAALVEGREPGDILRLNGLTDPIPVDTHLATSHGWSLPETIELARLTDTLPLELRIFAICGGNFTCGVALSPAVAAAAVRLELEVAALVGDCDRTGPAEQSNRGRAGFPR